jgi:hypothetical protein
LRDFLLENLDLTNELAEDVTAHENLRLSLARAWALQPAAGYLRHPRWGLTRFYFAEKPTVPTVRFGVRFISRKRTLIENVLPVSWGGLFD